MDLDFDKYCVIDGSPNTVLPSSRHCSKIERRMTKEKPRRVNEPLSEKKGFNDISFSRYRSASCSSAPSRTIPFEGHELRKRGSVYQSSQEVRNIKKLGDIGGRRKIEFPRSSATALTLGIVDSLCSSDEDSSQLEDNRSSLMSLYSESSTSVSKPYDSRDFLDHTCQPIPERVASSDSFLEISLGLDGRENKSAGNVNRQPTMNSKGRFDPAVGPLRDDNKIRERVHVPTSPKSLSAKLSLPHSPSQSESDSSNPSSPKSHFRPIRKMFDPFAKSKLQRNSLSSGTISDVVSPGEKVGISRVYTLQKSLLNDFSKMALDTQSNSQFVKKERNKPPRPCLPTHLCGLLKLENKHGVPFYEFMVKNLEDSFMAKAWKVGNPINWVYTFHKRKSRATGWGLKDSNKGFSMVGQMQVSCFLCAELNNAKAFDNSIMTEFVLYDIAQARKNVIAQNTSVSLPKIVKPSLGSKEISIEETCKLDDASGWNRIKLQPKHVSDGHNPWESADLHPNLELAAIIVQVPFEKRESLKGKGGDRKSDRPLPDLNDLPGNVKRTNCLIPAKVNVVTSSGNHSLPTTESPGPSRLLDRWKLGGGCDCGGWDMGCPLTVFGNSHIQCAEDHSFLNDEQPWKLYVQGGKEKASALKITLTEEGEYEVDFHAQMTALQAFSVCVAILHCTEASIAVGQETEKQQLSHCDSLKVFIDDDVKYLIESVTEKEKRKAAKKTEAPQSFVLNPPFSPIARV